MAVRMPVGRPAGPAKKPTAAERRANREAFQKLKAEVAANGHHTTMARKSRARQRAAQRFVAITRGGQANLTLSTLQNLTRDQIDALKRVAQERRTALTPEQRARLQTNGWIAVASLPLSVWEAIVEFRGAGLG